MDLVVAAHLGSASGVNSTVLGAGIPTFIGRRIRCIAYRAWGVASMIAHGIFESGKNLELVLIECGVAWLPGILWRLDNDYRTARRNHPGLAQRLPSDYARDHIRLTTQLLGDILRNAKAVA